MHSMHQSAICSFSFINQVCWWFLATTQWRNVLVCNIFHLRAIGMTMFTGDFPSTDSSPSQIWWKKPKWIWYCTYIPSKCFTTEAIESSTAYIDNQWRCGKMQGVSFGNPLFTLLSWTHAIRSTPARLCIFVLWIIRHSSQPTDLYTAQFGTAPQIKSQSLQLTQQYIGTMETGNYTLHLRRSLYLLTSLTMLVHSAVLVFPWDGTDCSSSLFVYCFQAPNLWLWDGVLEKI